MRTKNRSAKPKLATSVTKKTAPPSHPIHPGRNHTCSKEPNSRENPAEVQVDFAELEDGSLVEIVEDPTDPNQTLFAIFKRGRCRFAARVEDRGRMLVPIPRSTIGFSDVKLPCGILPCHSVRRLLFNISWFIRHAIDVPREYIALLSVFVLYTWVADRVPTAVYLSVIGLPQSGKTTLLELLSMICRQSLLTSDISEAAAYQACSNFSATLLIDEIDWHASKMSRPFRQLLRAGTSPFSRALRVRQSSCSFGAKVLGSLEASSDSALNSRCIQLVMTESNKRGLFKPSHPSMVKFASDLRQRLLRFRFNSYKSIRPAIISGAEKLRPRSRDLLCSLAAPVVGCRQSLTRFLLSFIKKNHDTVRRESLEPRQEALHAVLWGTIHQESPQSNVHIGGDNSLATATNRTLRLNGENVIVTDKAVGRMLDSMGFRSTQRTKTGWILWLDSSTRERSHQLLKTYDNKYLLDWDFAQHATTCSMCKTLRGSQ